MKKHHLLLTFFLLSFLFGCRKNSNHPGGPGGGGDTTKSQPKKWFAKSIISRYDATHFQHTVFVYDTALRITRVGYGLSAVADTFNQDVQRFTDYTYDKDGKFVSAKVFQSPGLTFVYLSPNSIQITSDPFDPGHDGVASFYFNGHSHGELDQTRSVIPPGNLFAGTTGRDYSYNDIGGIQSESDLQVDGTSQVAWTFLSGNGTPSIDNPFSNGKTMEQRLIYYLSYSFSPWDMLGGKWSNGTYENYTYASGSKVPYAHFWNLYTVDANGNVVSVTPQYTLLDDPKQAVVTVNTTYITYEQH